MKEKNELDWKISYNFQYNVLKWLKKELTDNRWCFYRDAESQWGSYLIDCIDDDMIYTNTNNLVYLTSKGEFLVLSHLLNHSHYSFIELFEGKQPEVSFEFKPKVKWEYVGDLTKDSLRSIIGLNNKETFIELECLLWD